MKWGHVFRRPAYKRVVREVVASLEESFGLDSTPRFSKAAIAALRLEALGFKRAAIKGEVSHFQILHGLIRCTGASLLTANTGRLTVESRDFDFMLKFAQILSGCH